MSSENHNEAIGGVLGRVPSGVFILVAGDGSQRKTGLLASWIQQASFEPPQVTVAVNKSRYLNEWLKDGAAVVINQIAKGDSVLFRHFGKGFEPDVDAFDGVEVQDSSNGLFQLKQSMASMEGTVVSQMEAGDHHIYLVEITGAVPHEDPADFDPFIHVRKNGFSY